MQLTGTYAVIFYAVSLFKDIGVSTNPYIPAIITGKKGRTTLKFTFPVVERAAFAVYIILSHC
jgi:hypothetical protein